MISDGDRLPRYAPEKRRETAGKDVLLVAMDDVGLQDLGSDVGGNRVEAAAADVTGTRQDPGVQVALGPTLFLIPKADKSRRCTTAHCAGQFVRVALAAPELASRSEHSGHKVDNPRSPWLVHRATVDDAVGYGVAATYAILHR